MSASQFADAIGVPRSSISHIINGRNNPSLELVQKILNRFEDVSPSWLVLGKGESTIIGNNLFPDFGNIVGINQISRPESDILNTDTAKDELLNSQRDINAEKSSYKTDIENNIRGIQTEENMHLKEKTGQKRCIERIIVFYSDKSFTEYIPEQ
ncbi:MAG: helix-turn-helix transcriptional regulator [Bacteroidales bacterium]|nr:helix-turn-helix transcriptional regulator [Bacteroidales bacterium]